MMNKLNLGFVLLALVLAGCSNDEDHDGGGTTDDSLQPPADGEGIQLAMKSALAAGVETERCMFHRVEQELAVNRQEIRYTPGSHHVLLYVTPYTEIPTADRFGDEVDTSGIFECGERGPTAHWEINGVAGGSQIADGPPGVDGLPEDTAFIIPAGTVLLMNTHYLNASGATMETDARINLYTIPREQVTREAGILFFYNPFIRVPADSDAVAREVCAVRSDIRLVNAQSHMHKRGVGYTATLLDADGAAVDDVYETDEWEEVTLRKFEPHLAISAGQSIDFQCRYSNGSDRTILQGLSTEDEMCMFLGLYYPRDRQTELCGMTEGWDGRFLGATWIGDGAADGTETAACLSGVEGIRADGGDTLYGCVVNSCPAIATPVSTAARCIASNGLGACAELCVEETAECRACVGEQCTDSMLALAGQGCG